MTIIIKTVVHLKIIPLGKSFTQKVLAKFKASGEHDARHYFLSALKYLFATHLVQ